MVRSKVRFGVDDSRVYLVGARTETQPVAICPSRRGLTIEDEAKGMTARERLLGSTRTSAERRTSERDHLLRVMLTEPGVGYRLVTE
jgi:hypothetical protein